MANAQIAISKVIDPLRWQGDSQGMLPSAEPPPDPARQYLSPCVPSKRPSIALSIQTGLEAQAAMLRAQQYPRLWSRVLHLATSRRRMGTQHRTISQTHRFQPTDIIIYRRMVCVASTDNHLSVISLPIAYAILTSFRVKPHVWTVDTTSGMKATTIEEQAGLSTIVRTILRLRTQTWTDTFGNEQH
jgi:hypothetical protein